MPLYVADYIADTGHLSTVEHGAYLLLIMHYWRHGGLPNDESRLAKICKVTPHLWKKIFPTIRDLFQEGWRHKRIDQELEKQEQISNKRSASAKQKHSKSSANAEQMHAQSQPQSQPQRRKKKPAAVEPPEFVDFWNSVPRKEGRYEAVIAYGKAISAGADPLKVNAAAKRWRLAEEKTEEKYIALPATWLNKRRYDDYHSPPERETNLEYDEATKEWRWKRGYEPKNPERTN